MTTTRDRPRRVVSSGFGDLFARALRRAPVVTLIDRHNHHLFQPLLYQVATAALNERHRLPIRGVLRKQYATPGSCSATLSA